MQGNILTLKRNGLIVPGVYGVVDDLTATFDGNQLASLSDAASDVLLESSLDLRSGQFSTGSFDYDANGNQTRDLSRSVDEVAYNPLNLPTVVTMADGSTIRYLYTAAGAKLSEIAITADGDTLSRRDYISNLEITAKGDSLHDRRLLLAEGYITLADTTFHAYIPDYQGNIIAVYNTKTDETEHQTDYYPYGLPHADTEASTPQSNRRKYGAKELTTDLGLNLYDFEARHQNPAFPTFTTVDDLAERYINISHYAFCAGDPINHSDLHGDSIYVTIKENGHNQQYYYEPSLKNLVNSATGEIYNGSDEGALKLIETLNDLCTGYHGRELVEYLAYNQNNVLVSPQPYRKSKKDYEHASQDRQISRVVWVYDNAVFYFPGSTLLTNLAHELAHAMDRMRGTIDERVWEEAPNIDGEIEEITYAEIYAVHIENLIRKEHSLELRPRYFFDITGKTKTTLIENGKSIYIDINGNHNPNYQPINKKMRYQY